MQGIKLLLVIAIAVSTDVTSVQGQHMTFQSKNVTVFEGESVNVKCLWGKPLRYCRIVLPDGSMFVLPQQNAEAIGIEYFGEGLKNGQCGVTIQSVRAVDHGTIKCQINSEDEEIEGHIGLTVARAPHPPELHFFPKSQAGFYEVGQPFLAYCISREGRPNPNLTLYLDDEPVDVGVESEITTLNGIQKQITRTIKASDDRRTLICRSRHLTDRGGQPQEDKMQFRIGYKPQPLPEIKEHRVILGSDAVINAIVKAYPPPRTEWIVEGTAIPRGTHTGRYKSNEPIDLGGGTFNVSLSIANLTLEDTTKIYKLQASNALGSQEYIARIAYSEAAGVTGGLGVAHIVRIASSEAAGVTGLGVAAIVGIVVGQFLL